MFELLPSYGSFFVDATLLVIAAIGWKRAWDAEKEVNAQASTWEATAKALKEELQSRPRAAFTLIEMLVVVTIMMIMVAAAATMMSPASDARRIREAARALSVYIGSARNRAMETGRPCGVILRRYGANGAVMTADQCEVPPCYCGDTTDAALQLQLSGVVSGIATVTGTVTPAGSMTPTLISVGDTIQFNYQGPFYSITTASATTIKATCDLSGGQILPWPASAPFPNVPYRIFRAPVKGGASPLQLPASAVVDLKFSGTDSTTFGAAGDVTILFSPTGSLQTFYYGNGLKSEASDAVYLLVGKNEKITNASGTTEATMNNMQDANNLWVVVTPQSGTINVANVAVKTATEDERSIARKGISLGGK